MTDLEYRLAPVEDPPVIGVTSYSDLAGWREWSTEAVLVPRSYVDLVALAGGVPVVLPPIAAVVETILPRLDGLVLAGGEDVDPVRYGQGRLATTVIHRERDAAETALLSGALRDGLPVLGICRGLQLLNVVRGGSLVQHLPTVLGHDGHRPAAGAFGRHTVRIHAGSRLASILAAGTGRVCAEVSVATAHHQGVDELGTGLVATAWTPDGVVEAVEDPSLPFCVAVQWHPEEGPDGPHLAGALVTAARARAAGRRGSGRRRLATRSDAPTGEPGAAEAPAAAGAGTAGVRSA